MFDKPINLLLISLLTTLSLTLTGCGGGSEAAEGAARKPLDYVNGSSSNETIHEENATSNQGTCEEVQSASNQYCVHVQANEAMIASWKSELFDLLTPAKAYALRGLDNVRVRTLSVVQLSANKNEISSSLVPDYTVSENSDLSYLVTFNAAIPNSRMDIFVKATLDNGDVLYAPFVIESANRITVNIVTDYLVDKLFEKVDNNTSQWRHLLPCTNTSTDYGCTNQALAKSSVWQGLAEMSQNYEFDIPSTLNIEQAKGFLDTRADFNQHIALTLDTLLDLESPFVDAILQNPDDLTDAIGQAPSSEYYNNVFFSFGMNQGKNSSDKNTAIFSTALSRTASAENGIGKTYPSLLIGIIRILGVTYNSIGGDTPFDRQYRTHSPFGFDILKPEETNSLASALSSTFQHRSGNYLLGTSPYQTITDKSSTSGIGWQFDPYAAYIYRTQENPDNTPDISPDILVSTPFNRGAVYSLDRLASSTWQRNRLIEEQNLFSYNVYLPTSLSEEFTLDAINGKTYGKVGFNVRLGVSNDDIRVQTDVSIWDASSADIDESQPNDNADMFWQHYRHQSLVRNINGAVTSTITSYDNNDSFRIDQLTTLESTAKGLEEVHRGRISLDLQEGSASVDGSQIAITTDDNGSQRGIAHAIELRTTTPALNQEIYQLSGNSIAVSGANTKGINYNGSSIQFTSNTDVLLTLTRLQVAHEISSFTVSDPEVLETLTVNGTYSVVRGMIQMQFNGVDSTNDSIKLTGFVSKAPELKASAAPGNLMILTMEQGNQLGMLYATRDQQLSFE